MFDFHVFIPHGNGWKQVMNVQANDYQEAARKVYASWPRVERVKVQAMDEAAAAGMPSRTMVIYF